VQTENEKAVRDPMREAQKDAKEAAIRMWNQCGEQLLEADNVLRSISSYLGQGGMWDTENLDYDEVEKRIKEGIDAIVEVERKRATASQESAPGQEAVAASTQEPDLIHKLRGLAAMVESQEGWRPTVVDEAIAALSAPPTSTAIAAMVIKQAAEVVREWKRDYVLNDCCDQAQNNACIAIEQDILTLAPANTEAELEALIANRVDAAVEAFRLTAAAICQKQSDEAYANGFRTDAGWAQSMANAIRALTGSSKALEDFGYLVARAVEYAPAPKVDTGFTDEELRAIVQSFIRKG
jgi:hypothetical protein